MDERQTAEERERQIQKLIEAGTEENKQAIEKRDDQGLRWKKELQELERRAGL